MYKAIFIGFASLFVALPAQAEECFSYQTSSKTEGAQINMMKQMAQRPEMRQMMKSMNQSFEPEETIHYMTARRAVTVAKGYWSIMDYEKLTMTSVSPVEKSYSVFDIRAMAERISDQPRKETNGPSMKMEFQPPIATGRKLKFAGVECNEFRKTTTTSVNPGEQNRTGKAGDARMAGFKSTSSEVVCINKTQPEAYFRMQAAQLKLASANAPAMKPENLQKYAKLNAQASMLGISAEGADAGAARGFELSSTHDLPMMTITKTVTKIGQECAPEKYLSIPSGFKDTSAKFERSTTKK